MFNYIFPIFAFGIVISGIVAMGLQQASDLAKDLAAARTEAEKALPYAETSALHSKPGASKTS